MISLLLKQLKTATPLELPVMNKPTAKAYKLSIPLQGVTSISIMPIPAEGIKDKIDANEGNLWVIQPLNEDSLLVLSLAEVESDPILGELGHIVEATSLEEVFEQIEYTVIDETCSICGQSTAEDNCQE
jgi:hypothetical protein